jgi:hypothetical protein
VKHESSSMSHVTRVAFIAMLFTVMVPFYTLDVNAVPDTVVTVEPSSTSVAVSDTFCVNVSVFDVQNLYGLEMTLSWNSTILHLVKVEILLGQNGGVLNPPVYIAENLTLENRYSLSATSTSPAPSFYGTGNVVSMNFSVNNIGTCMFDLQTQLYDYPPLDRDPRLSLPIAHTDVDGVFTGVIPEFSHHLIFVAIISLTLFSVVLSKRISCRRNKIFDKSERADNL